MYSCRDDANDAGLRLPRIRAQYEKSPDPKELVILEGSAHAQFIFETDQGERLMADEHFEFRGGLLRGHTNGTRTRASDQYPSMD